MSDKVVRVQGLWKSYNDEGQNVVEALRGASMELSRGEIVALFGKSGSGKSTLLHLIAGLDRPTEGLIEINGQNIEHLS
jgi:ABC-type lipoprotein export system ATPase subunit